MAGGTETARQCFTCEYYDGGKKTTIVHSVEADEYAKCENHASDRHNNVVHYSNTCNQWIRWRKISL